MEKQTRTNKYKNLRGQLKKESSYIEETQVLQSGINKGVIKQEKHETHSVNPDLIERTIIEIRNDIINNPNKTPEEIAANLKMFEERVTLARKNTSNVETMIQQINQWQKPAGGATKPIPRVNTITNSTRSTTMLNAVNVDLTVDDLIKARQEVAERLKNTTIAAKSTIKLDPTIMAKVNTPPMKTKHIKTKKYRIFKVLKAAIITILITVLIISVLLLVGFIMFPNHEFFTWLKEFVK